MGLSGGTELSKETKNLIFSDNQYSGYKRRQERARPGFPVATCSPTAHYRRTPTGVVWE